MKNFEGKNYVRVKKKNFCVRKNLRAKKKFGKTYAPRTGGGGGPILWPRTSRYSTTIGNHNK